MAELDESKYLVSSRNSKVIKLEAFDEEFIDKYKFGV